MRRIVLIYGLIAGGILSAMMFGSMAFQEQIGFDGGMIIGYASMVAAFLMIFFGVRSYRDSVAGGQVAFGQAFKVGLLIMLLACVMYVLSWEIISYRMVPDFADRYAAHIIAQARESGASAAELAEQQRKMDEFRESYRNPLIRAAFTFLEPLPVGLVFTLVTAAILRRRRPASPAVHP